ncbi:alpha/beta fold hydrolase [Nocardia africana]|uniref:Alpha/beta fold hydrolase n=1 Tax=Nocardia africana TaxID=134964 RepID=A0ABW6NUT4_9NOCA
MPHWRVPLQPGRSPGDALTPAIAGVPGDRTADAPSESALSAMTEQRQHRSARLRSRSVLVEGRIAHYSAGGRGPRVLFLHGWGLGRYAYTRPLEELVRMGVHVFAPALPGFGGTAGLPIEQRSLAGYARWVGAFIEAIDLPLPVTVVGHSFGGGVAIQAAHDVPELAERLVLVNSIGGSAWTDGRGVARALRERPLWDWGLHLPADLLPGRQLTRVLPVIMRDAVPNVLRNPTAVWEVAHLARTANLTSELTTLAERRLPVFVVWSKRDTVIPESTSMSLRTALGDPRTITVPGGHSWLIDDPHAFGELITNVVLEPGSGFEPDTRPTAQ